MRRRKAKDADWCGRLLISDDARGYSRNKATLFQASGRSGKILPRILRRIQLEIITFIKFVGPFLRKGEMQFEIGSWIEF